MCFWGWEWERYALVRTELSVAINLIDGTTVTPPPTQPQPPLTWPNRFVCQPTTKTEYIHPSLHPGAFSAWLVRGWNAARRRRWRAERNEDLRWTFGRIVKTKGGQPCTDLFLWECHPEFKPHSSPYTSRHASGTPPACLLITLLTIRDLIIFHLV